jgi:hypothetical protein
MASISWDTDPDDPTKLKPNMEIVEITEQEMITFFKILGMLGTDTKLHLAKGISSQYDAYMNKYGKKEFDSIVNIKPIKLRTKDLW